MKVFARNVVVLWLAMLAMLAVVAVTAMPALAQGAQEQGDVNVTFDLAIDGEVPEGQSVSLGLPGTVDLAASFCGSDSALPVCEDGGTYTATFLSIGGGEPSTGPFPIPAGGPLSYEYQVYAADGSLVETLESETITPTEDTTVSVTYSPEGGQTPPPSDDGEPGPGDQYENDDPPAPDGQYEDNDPSAPGGQDAEPGQSPSVDSSGGQDQPISVLPDTGGISLAVGLLGVLMIGGGLISRRLLG